MNQRRTPNALDTCETICRKRVEKYFDARLRTAAIDPDLGDFTVDFQLSESSRGWYRIAVTGRWAPKKGAAHELTVDKKVRLAKPGAGDSNSRRKKRPIDRDVLVGHVANLIEKAALKFMEHKPFRLILPRIKTPPYG